MSSADSTHGIVVRNLAWTCYARMKGRLTRCEHLNARGGVLRPVDPANPRRGMKAFCEECGAPYEKSHHDNHSARTEADAHDIAPRSTVAEIVRAYERTEAAIRSSFAAIVAAGVDMSRAVGEPDDSIRVSATGNRGLCRFDEPDEAVDLVRREVWRTLIRRLDIQRLMAVTEWEAFTKSLEEKSPPPISEDYINGFMSRIMAGMAGMHERAVLEVFDWLRPRCEERRTHKANHVWHIGPRVVLTWQVEQAWHPGRFRLRIGNDHQRLVAFENVFCVLDGAPKYESSGSELGHAIAAAPNGIGETRWFKFRCFKNGNLHLEFRRPDLIARINQIAGSRAMRPSS
jgi:hypothetical protein